MTADSPVAKQVGSALIATDCREVSLRDISSSSFMGILKKMRAVNDQMGGVGISAPQVGSDLRISMITVRPTKYRPTLPDMGEVIMINPVILDCSGQQSGYEGCLSVAEAGIFAKVQRANSINVEWLDLSGKTQRQAFDGFVAVVIQHELAHLDGRVFLQEPTCDLSTLASRNEYFKIVSKG